MRWPPHDERLPADRQRPDPRAWLVFLVGSFAVGFLHYPFFLSGDSWIWLSQARSGVWMDIQPVGAVALWSVLDRLYPGPFLFVLLNIVLVVGGTVLIAFRSVRGVALATAVVALCLFWPATFSILGVAWRDITGLGLVLIALGLTSYLFGPGKPSKFVFAGAVVLIAVVGPIFRLNDAAGMAPILCAALFFAIVPRASIRLRLAAALGAAFLILALATLSAIALTRSLAAEHSYSKQARWNYFLGQLSLETGSSLMPAEVYPELTLADLEEFKRLSGGLSFLYYTMFWRENATNLPRLRTAHDLSVLESAYSAAWRRYPIAALKVRWRIFREVAFGLPRSNRYVDFFAGQTQFPVVWPGGNDVDIDFDIEPARWTRSSLKTMLPSVAQQLPGHPLVYLLGAALASGLAFWRRLPSWRLIALASTAAASHYAGVVIYAFGYENRFGHQSIYLSLLAMGLSGGAWFESWREEKRELRRK